MDRRDICPLTGLPRKSTWRRGQRCPGYASCPRRQWQIDEILAQMEEPTIASSLLTFFIENRNPTDKQVHEFARQKGIDPHELEENVYALLTSLIDTCIA